MHELNRRYFDILKNTNQEFVHKLGKDGLSGLFLASEPDGYQSAQNKIMLIGRETLGWGVVKTEPFSIESYIEASLDRHRKELSKQKNTQGKAFHNFRRELDKNFGKDGLIYANLFCASFNKTMPRKSADYERIKVLSKQLLWAQIEHFQPSVIIFACGLTGEAVTQRRELVPPVKCLERKTYEGIPNTNLWDFTIRELEDCRINQPIRCFRIHHPSSTSPNAPKAQKKMIELIKMHFASTSS